MIKVRTGYAAKPPLRGGTFEGTDEAIATEIEGVVDDLRGGVGLRKGKNLQDFRKVVFRARQEGGSSAQAMDDLLALGRSYS